MSFLKDLVSTATLGAVDFGDTMTKQWLAKKNIRDQAQLQYDYAQRYSLNSPSWAVSGLRNAGLNPILAVSNGVNLGANIPNLSYSSPRDSQMSHAMSSSLDRSVARDNVAINQQNADTAKIQAEATIKRALADIENTRADTALKIIDAERQKGSKYDSSSMRDAEKLLDNITDRFKDYKDMTVPLESYLFPFPKAKNTNAREIAEKKRYTKKGAYSPYVPELYKSYRKFDGQDVYKKRLGGMMPIYR